MKWIHTMRGTKVIRAKSGEWRIAYRNGVYYVNGPTLKAGSANDLPAAKKLAEQRASVVFKMEEPTKDLEEDRAACLASEGRGAPLPTPVREPVDNAEARNAGESMARVIFKKHGQGTNVEIHLSQETLALMLAMAYDFGMKRAGPLGGGK